MQINAFLLTMKRCFESRTENTIKALYDSIIRPMLARSMRHQSGTLAIIKKISIMNMRKRKKT